MFGLSLVGTEAVAEGAIHPNENVRLDRRAENNDASVRSRRSKVPTFEELDKSQTGYTVGNSTRPDDNLKQKRPVTEQCKSILAQPQLPESNAQSKVKTQLSAQSTEQTKPVPTLERFSGDEAGKLPTSSLREEIIDQKKNEAYAAAKSAMFDKQYKVWEAERKPYVDCLLQEILAAEIAIVSIGWNENLISYFLPCFLASHVVISLLSQLTVPMFHDEGVVLRKMNVMTLFHFITLVIVSSSIILSGLSSYGNFYVIKDAAAAHSSMMVLRLDIDSCEAECARQRTCLLYQHKGEECRLFNTTLEQADLGPLNALGNTLAVKKIVKSSRYESDGQLYYLSDLVSTGQNCTRCQKACEGYFHVARLPRTTKVLKEIVRRGDALNHPVLYEEGSFVPFCWNINGRQNCRDSNALDAAAKYRIYYRGKDLSNFRKKSVKVLCQASPLGTREISEKKMVFEFKDLCKEWIDSFVCTNAILRMMATEINEFWFELKNVVSEVLLFWYSSTVDYLNDCYCELEALIEGEE